MTKSKPTLLAATLLLAALFTLSCSDGGGGNDAVVKKAKISGVSQKGPFVEGSTATLYELNNDLSQTGRSFRDIIADNKGTFEITDVELVSPYAMLEASGYYRNEITGNVSAAPITLFAIADVREKDNINVNILTHLEYYRVRNLVENGKTLAEAKKQAQKEILAVFGIDSDGFKDSEDMSIFGTSESDAALLAISILLASGPSSNGDGGWQSSLSEGEFSQRLTNFSQAIRNGGTLEEDVMKAMANWVLYSKGRMVSTMSEIKDYVLGWGLSTEVPNFEKYIRAYSNFVIGEVCDDEAYGSMKDWDWQPSNSASLNVIVCKDNGWEPVDRSFDKGDYVCFETKMCDGIFIDARDGNKYRTATMGDGNALMIDYLRYTDNGNIGSCDDRTGICSYEQDDWLLACPAGWHFPNEEDIGNIVSFLDPHYNNNFGIWRYMVSYLNNGAMSRYTSSSDGSREELLSNSDRFGVQCVKD